MVRNLGSGKIATDSIGVGNLPTHPCCYVHHGWILMFKQSLFLDRRLLPGVLVQDMASALLHRGWSVWLLAAALLSSISVLAVSAQGEKSKTPVATSGSPGATLPSLPGTASPQRSEPLKIMPYIPVD